MATKVLDNCQMETATQGTGTYTVTDTPSRSDLFSLDDHRVAGNLADGELVYAAFRQVDAGAEWGVYEYSQGTGAGGADQLLRDTILGSTNSGAAVNWGSGTKTVVICWVAASGVLLAENDLADVDDATEAAKNLAVLRLAGTTTAGEKITGDVDVEAASIDFTSLQTVEKFLSARGASSEVRLRVEDGAARFAIGWNVDESDQYVDTGEEAALVEVSPDQADRVFRIRYAASGTAGGSITWSDLFTVHSTKVEADVELWAADRLVIPVGTDLWSEL